MIDVGGAVRNSARGVAPNDTVGRVRMRLPLMLAGVAQLVEQLFCKQ